jgi:hypothetical protein
MQKFREISNIKWKNIIELYRVTEKERERKEFLCKVNTNVQKKVEKSLLLFKIKDVAEAC